VRACFCF